jgi:hypothetical protein
MALCAPLPKSVRRQLQGIADRLTSGEADTGKDTLERLRNFVHLNLADVRRVMNADIERARAEIARHVSRIEMKPISSPGGRGHYVAIGDWNLLGTALETDRAPYLLGGGARMVAGDRNALKIPRIPFRFELQRAAGA